MKQLIIETWLVAAAASLVMRTLGVPFAPQFLVAIGGGMVIAGVHRLIDVNRDPAR